MAGKQANQPTKSWTGSGDEGVTFNRLAERELSEAFEFYQGERPGLGDELREEVRHAILLLVRYPELGRAIRGPIRQLVLPRFPYSILYRPLEEGQIRILALAHHRRHPDYWMGRD